MVSETEPPKTDRAPYWAALEKFDAAICEAISVSQASSGRLPAPNVGYASFVFTRMCSTGVSLIRATPLSRWVRSDFEDWNFGAIAGHARSLLDGYLLFSYLIQPVKSEAELKTRINVMHLNDCMRRIKFHTDLGITEDLSGFEMQREELCSRLTENEYFKSLSPEVKKDCLRGKFLMIDNRDEMLAKVGFKKGEFNSLYDLLSQYVHILPMSFYRIKANGRSTGIENDTDRVYMTQTLAIGAVILTEATDKMVKQFPNTISVRKGTKSIFSPGPIGNRPRKPNGR